MKLRRFSAVPLLLATCCVLAAHAQLVHLSATSDRLFGELVGYPPAAEPMAGTARFDLYYDAGVVGTDGVFTFADPTKNYWTLTAIINPDGTQPDLPLNEIRSFSFPLETMALAPASGDDPTPGALALRSPPLDPGERWFDVGFVPSGPPLSLPVPPVAFARSWNYVQVSFAEEGWEGAQVIGASLRNFSAEIISPVPEPSTYGLAGGIVVLGCIVCRRRRRSVTAAAGAP